MRRLLRLETSDRTDTLRQLAVLGHQARTLSTNAQRDRVRREHAFVLVTEGDELIALGHYSGTYKAENESIRAPFLHAGTVRDERIVRFVQYIDTVLVQHALEA
ncbi:nuclear transport factor 2 family protein [Aureimonas ureilytica]|uniref:nuclear transport factor 2 family protein n=1 Tax=Aureimonas ureilytica TaxID=401562 RepID=UPI0003A7563D|nr:hypothetical protein [Aureimonas ureilytica]